MVIAAVAVAAVGVAGSVASGNAQRSAARKAANAQTQAGEQANQVQLDMYNDQRDLLEPGITAGASAQARQMLMMGYSTEEVKAYLTQMQTAVNAPGPSLEGDTTTPVQRRYATQGVSLGGSMSGNAEQPYSSGELSQMQADEEAAAAASAAPQDNFDWVDGWQWEQTPSYGFRLEQGAEAINRNLAARGLYGSGAAAQRLTEFGQDMASQEFGNVFANYGALAGQGASNTNTTVNVAGQYGDNAARNYRYIGDSRASGYIRRGEADAEMYKGIADSIGGAIGYGWG